MRMALAALVLFALAMGILWFNAPDPSSESTQLTDDWAAEIAPDAEPDVQPAPPVGRARAIAPDIIAIPRIEPEELARGEAREPLSPLGVAPDPASLPPRPRVLHRPVALAAGLVEVQGHRIALAGLELLGPEEVCEHEGRNWPCGVLARTAFRGYLRARALSCTVPAVPGGEIVVTACRIGDQDPALWLARQGWARGGEEAYREAIEDARAAGRGIFGPPPGL